MPIDTDTTPGGLTAFATLQLGVARSDGHLSLTPTELHFAPLNDHLGLGPYALTLDKITKVVRCWGKGAGVMPLTDEGVEITLSDGRQLQFVLANAELWLSRIQAALPQGDHR
ncbi:hypothetical protein [Ferrimonas balearica]|uniref:hypothetical protein n=1 Tax=Ferrimonas balearica TaxID=44012 RepID=UPI001C99F8E9|nr:hypothetical protein [Ferrimonas balearica]MBY5991326.1 hypothetical protein [Ferrimonas balearica]